MGVNLSEEDRLEVFGDDNPDQHADEAAQRWGDSEAFSASARRTSSYGKQDWLDLRREGEEVEQRLAQLLASGVPADADAATSAAEAHRSYISRWFYDCSSQIHVGLAQMYVTDPRFTAHYERRATGLAQYVHDAIVANAAAADT